MILAAASCGNKSQEGKTSIYESDSTVSDTAAAAAVADTAIAAVQADTATTVKEIAEPPKENKQIDKLMNKMARNIAAIKQEGYDMDGKPFDAAELQFGDVKDYIRDLRNDMSKLQSMQAEMSEQQSSKFKSLEKQANRIYRDIPL